MNIPLGTPVMLHNRPAVVIARSYGNLRYGVRYTDGQTPPHEHNIPEKALELLLLEEVG